MVILSLLPHKSKILPNFETALYIITYFYTIFKDTYHIFKKSTSHIKKTNITYFIDTYHIFKNNTSQMKKKLISHISDTYHIFKNLSKPISQLKVHCKSQNL